MYYSSDYESYHESEEEEDCNHVGWYDFEFEGKDEEEDGPDESSHEIRYEKIKIPQNF